MLTSAVDRYVVSLNCPWVGTVNQLTHKNAERQHLCKYGHAPYFTWLHVLIASKYVAAATSAMQTNISDTYLYANARQVKSDTYKQYVKIPPQELAHLLTLRNATYVGFFPRNSQMPLKWQIYTHAYIEPYRMQRVSYSKTDFTTLLP